MPRTQQTDYAAELQKTFDQWDIYDEYGGSDPFYTDGYNMNHLRRQIQILRKQIEKNLNLFGYPEIYCREIPPEIDENYMARADEIRTAARASLEAYRADSDYQFILAHREEIPPKAQKKICIDAVLGYAAGLEYFIAEDDLVAMRRHEHAERYLDSFAPCAQRMRDYMTDGMESTAIDEPEDEDFEEEYDEEFCEEPEHEFGGMTMTMSM